jgi:polyisoprenoid-binding protein YceI
VRRLLWLALLLALPAAATPWRMDETTSRLGFLATQAGAQFEGRFTRFTADVEFDPTRPEDGSFDVRIAVASADTGESQRDDIIRGPDFFAASQFPEARYQASGFRPQGEGFLAEGSLTLRGVTRPVAISFSFTPAAGGGGRLAGKATVSRLAFGVGQGEWQSTEWVGDRVDVVFDLKLTR